MLALGVKGLPHRGRADPGHARNVSQVLERDAADGADAWEALQRVKLVGVDPQPQTIRADPQRSELRGAHRCEVLAKNALLRVNLRRLTALDFGARQGARCLQGADV